MLKRLLAIDLDGTLLDHHGRPHEKDVLAVRAALAAGVSVSIVTGRLYSGTRAAAEILGLRGAVGCADGSHVVDAGHHGTLLRTWACAGKRRRSFAERLSRASLSTFVFAKDAIGHDARGAEVLVYISTWSNDIRHAKDVYEHDLWGAEDGLTAVVALGSLEQVTQAEEELRRDLSDAVFVVRFPLRRGPHVGTWAIMARRASGGTKGTAVRWISEREGIRIEDAPWPWATGSTICPCSTWRADRLPWARPRMKWKSRALHLRRADRERGDRRRRGAGHRRSVRHPPLSQSPS